MIVKIVRVADPVASATSVMHVSIVYHAMVVQTSEIQIKYNIYK